MQSEQLRPPFVPAPLQSDSAGSKCLFYTASSVAGLMPYDKCEKASVVVSHCTIRGVHAAWGFSESVIWHRVSSAEVLTSVSGGMPMGLHLAAASGPPPPIPGVRNVDPDARLLIDTRQLLPVVTGAIDAVVAAFDGADIDIDIEYFVDPDSEDLFEALEVAVFTNRSDRLERVRAARRELRRLHPQSGPVRVGITAHGV